MTRTGQAVLPLQGRTAAFATSVMCLLKAREWWKFVPDEAIIASDPGCGAARKAAVKSTDGDECYVYFPSVSAAEIVMNRITAGSRVSVAWFDPRCGAVQPAGSCATSQTVSLTPPPDWEDAVLCMTAVGGQIHVGQRPVGSK